jgi:hypothetical protein
MFFNNLFPTLPTSPLDTVIYAHLAVGIFLLFYATFVELEHRQDLIRILGAAAILLYAIVHSNIPLIWVAGAIFLGSAIQFTEILLGLHTHSPEDLKRYQKMWRLGGKNKK